LKSRTKKTVQRDNFRKMNRAKFKGVRKKRERKIDKKKVNTTACVLGGIAKIRMMLYFLLMRTTTLSSKWSIKNPQKSGGPSNLKKGTNYKLREKLLDKWKGRSAISSKNAAQQGSKRGVKSGKLTNHYLDALKAGDWS